MVSAVLMGVFRFPLQSRLCSKFKDSASGKVLYKNFLASMGVQGLPAAHPANAVKDRPPCEHVQKGPPPESAER